MYIYFIEPNFFRKIQKDYYPQKLLRIVDMLFDMQKPRLTPRLFYYKQHFPHPQKQMRLFYFLSICSSRMTFEKGSRLGRDLVTSVYMILSDGPALLRNSTLL